MTKTTTIQIKENGRVEIWTVTRQTNKTVSARHPDWASFRSDYRFNLSTGKAIGRGGVADWLDPQLNMPFGKPVLTLDIAATTP